jgi:hypothetical protein
MLEAKCEVRTNTVATTPEFPHMISMTCDRPAVSEIDVTFPAVQGAPLTFRVRLCEQHIQSYTGWN